MTQKDFQQVATNKLEVLQSPLTLLPGMAPIFSIDIAGSGVITSPTMKLFKGSKDVSATNLSGSMSVSGRSVTTKQLYNLTPGDWVFYIYYLDDGIATERFCRMYIAKEGA